jgi:hypothetical protein
MGLLDAFRGKSEEELLVEQLDKQIDEGIAQNPAEFEKTKKEFVNIGKTYLNEKRIEDKLVISDLRKMCIDLIGQAPKETLFQEGGAQVIFQSQILIRICERFFPSETWLIQELVRLCGNCIHKFNPETTTWYFLNPPTRDDYDVFLWIFAAAQTYSTEQQENWYIRNGFATVSDFKSEKTSSVDASQRGAMPASTPKEAKSDFESIINAIEFEFEPEKITDEEHLQAQLSIFLKAKFPNAIVEREIKTAHGDRIDVLVDGKFAFELKVPDERVKLRNLMAQLEEYKEQYNDICAIILDNQSLDLSDTIREYAEKYKSKLGVRSIILTGKKRG